MLWAVRQLRMICRHVPRAEAFGLLVSDIRRARTDQRWDRSTLPRKNRASAMPFLGRQANWF